MRLPYPEHLAIPSPDHDGLLKTNSTFIIIIIVAVVIFYWNCRFGTALNRRCIFLEISWYYFYAVVQTFGGCHTVHIELQCDGYFYNAFIYSVLKTYVQSFSVIMDC